MTWLRLIALDLLCPHLQWRWGRTDGFGLRHQECCVCGRERALWRAVV